jgi:protein-disulfide isomerase
MDQYIATGKVSYVFVDMPLAALHPTSHLGHAAARCVAEQGAARFWSLHDALFTHQDQWRSLPDPTSYLADVAKQTGVDMSQYTQCMSSGRSETAVQQSVAAGEALGFNGTPTFRFIAKEDGKTYTLSGAYPVDTFHQWIDQLLAGKAPAQDQPEPAATAKPAELPLWASAKGLAPDPNRAGYTLAGDPYKGDPKALVTVVEFSDFQCPACQKHHTDIQPAIDKALVDTGKIMWVFKNLPLREHPQASAAAAAAECAGKQGKFWPMHDLLFTSQASWAVDSPDSALLKLAGNLQLDAAQFTACYNSRDALEPVLRDVQDSQGVATTTPTFIILSGGKGSILNGSRPADQFISILQKFIDTASTEK